MREGLPEWDYAVTVTRSAQPDRFEIYTTSLWKRLPRFSLPLASGDRQTVVDLEALFSQAFNEGGFADNIGCREPPTEVIASCAYRIWELEGRPHDQDQDHWYRAIRYLLGRAPVL